MKTLISAVLTALIAVNCTSSNDRSHTGLETVARADGDAVVARVNGTPLYASDVDLTAQEQGLVSEGIRLPKTDARYSGVLEELIDQRLLALDADTRGLAADRNAQIRLATARERVLGNMVVERHLRNTVNETTIRRMYEEQSKLAARGDEVRARHILVEEKAKAEEILKSLEAGKDFAALAIENSIDEGSAGGGGDLGYFTQDMLDAEFTRPIFNAGKGERLGPIKSEFGWHIVEILDQRPAQQPSFETLKPQIANFMTFDAIQSLLKDLREWSDVEILTEGVETEDTAESDTQLRPAATVDSEAAPGAEDTDKP